MLDEDGVGMGSGACELYSFVWEVMFGGFVAEQAPFYEGSGLL